MHIVNLVVLNFLLSCFVPTLAAFNAAQNSPPGNFISHADFDISVTILKFRSQDDTPFQTQIS
jgi:hypothetical protein